MRVSFGIEKVSMGCLNVPVDGSIPSLIDERGQGTTRARREQTTKNVDKVVEHRRAADAGWSQLGNAISPSLHSHGHDGLQFAQSV